MGTMLSDGSLQQHGEPSGQSPVMLVGVAAGLLVALVVTVVLLMRQLKKARASVAEEAKPAAPAAVAPAKVAAAPVVAAVDAPPPGEEEDLTRMRAFSRDMLPNLSEDEEDDEDALPIEESKAEVRFVEDSLFGQDEATGRQELFVTTTAGRSDVGRRRRRNEDALVVDEGLDLYVVCDGMGGYAGGDLAAQTAASEVKKIVASGDAQPVHPPEQCPPRGRPLVAAVEKANEAVWKVGSSSPDLAGMGTTIVSALFNRKKNRVYIAHIGDSRVYRVRRGKLKQITVDHTLAAKGVVGPLASSVRRAVGTRPEVKVDVAVDKPLPNDLYLLCTDGMYNLVNEDEILRIVEEKRGAAARWSKDQLDAMASTMIDAANAAGGRDNVTVLLVGVDPPT